jgi:23S rRNA pseudouridine2605 synthase
MLIRLQKILSTAGVASRRASEKLIVEGRVSVNGTTVNELGTRADPEHDAIRVDGRQVQAPRARRYLLMNKPRGYVTTRSDPEGRPTVIDLLGRTREYIYPVGRLDYDSEGLLLLTNDGELAARLMHPRHEVEREYEVRVRGVPTRAAIERLERGVTIEGRKTAPATVRLHEAARESRATLTIILHEGRSRQVRKMCEVVGYQVVRLRRVRIGPIADPTLRAGEVRDLTPAEIRRLTAALEGSPARSSGSRPGSRAEMKIRQHRTQKPKS